MRRRRDADLSALDAARTAELLDRFAVTIEAAVRQFRDGGARVSLEPDDLRQLARLAVLEAALSHRPSRAALGTWVRRNVRWRLLEALEAEARPEEPLEAPEAVLNGENPEELVERLQLVGWIRAEIDQLDVRQRTILACRLGGETYTAIGATLGIGRTQTWRDTSSAFAVLRLRAREDRLDVERDDS